MSSSSWLTSRTRRKYVSRSSDQGQLPDQNAHSCSLCQFLIHSPAKGGPFSLQIHISKKLAEKGMKDGCAFIKWCVTEAAEVGKTPPLEFNIHFITKKSKLHDIMEAEFKFHTQFGPSLTVCACRDDPAAQHITTRPINPDPSIDASFALASHWIEECHAQHPECLTKDENFTPFMLIDVGSDGGQNPKLHIRQGEEKLQWCCLSYCWGGDQLIKTTKTTRDPFIESIPWELLPLTVQDAIKTARVLGIPYLWVDSLCITQDDMDEMTSQMALMSKIYKYAHVTIVASNAGKSTDGFLQRRQVQESDFPLFALPYHSPNSQTGSLCFFSDNGYDPREEPVRQRAWTMQERLLSIRILDYGTRHMRWACRTETYGDGGYRNPIPSGAEAAERLNPQIYKEHIRNEVIAGSFGRLQLLNSWNSLVQDYTLRYLTVSEDKLPAISGIAREYSEALGAAYFAGTFEELLPNSLWWHVEDETQKMRPSTYRAPSFSWASVDSPVSWLCAYHGSAIGLHTPTEAAVIIERNVKLTKVNEMYGAISSCALKLKARVVEDQWTGHPGIRGSGLLSKFRTVAIADAIDKVFLQLMQSQSVSVYVIGVMKSGAHWYAIVAGSDDGQSFRRLGYVEPCRSIPKEWPWQEIILV